jgi:hypothetical protein
MLEPIWNDARERQVESVYIRSKDKEKRKSEKTDDEKDMDRMVTTYGEKVCCIVVVTSTEDMNESGMVVANVHRDYKSIQSIQLLCEHQIRGHSQLCLFRPLSSSSPSSSIEKTHIPPLFSPAISITLSFHPATSSPDGFRYPPCL